jgi:aspartyl-tRNA(Asn)/glutamyl-tRNA(Gln) amidotransferase subunit C
MVNQQAFSSSQVEHIAQLASIPLKESEVEPIAQAFGETLEVIANLSSVDTTDVEPTAQTTGLENVWREDEVRAETTLSQAEALANASATHDGYFVVERILHHDK